MARDWKSTILPFVLGVLSGRYSMKVGQNAYYPPPQPEAGEAEYEGRDENREPTQEQITEAFFLSIGVWKEVARECGLIDEHYAVDVQESIKSSREKIAPRLWLFPPDVRTELESLLDRFSAVVGSSAPTVPGYVPDDVLRLAAWANEVLVAKFVKELRQKQPDVFAELESFLPPLEAILQKWGEERRPETYMEPLRQGILTIRAQFSTMPPLPRL